MRLAELDPRWMVMRDGGDVVGITFRCPHCPPGERGSVTFLGVKFQQLIDRDGVDVDEKDWPTYMAQHPDDHFWTRSGDSFDNLSLSPSVDASGVGHWHGHVSSGAIT